MIEANDVTEALEHTGYTFFSSVPCSYMTPLFHVMDSSPAIRHVPACSEGEAVGLAVGGWLGGKGAGAICQNSGLGNMVNPLTSLVYPFAIPLLLFVSRRGDPAIGDEPQHELMGEITYDLLEKLRVSAVSLPASPVALFQELQAVRKEVERSRRTVAFVVDKGAIGGSSRPVSRDETSPARRTGPVDVVTLIEGDVPTRAEVLAAYLEMNLDRGVVASTGHMGRELFTLSDLSAHFYMVGSMGCASSIALGVALANEQPITVLDGDGALLMKLGTLATVGKNQPKRLLHILLNNEIHDSTGGQPSNASSVNFAQVAAACGYRHVWDCAGRTAMRTALKQAAVADGPSFVHCRVLPGSLAKLGRPDVHPSDVALRFREYLGSRHQYSVQGAA